MVFQWFYCFLPEDPRSPLLEPLPYLPDGACVDLFLQLDHVPCAPRCVAFSREAKVQRERIRALDHAPGNEK